MKKSLTILLVMFSLFAKGQNTLLIESGKAKMVNSLADTVWLQSIGTVEMQRSNLVNPFYTITGEGKIKTFYLSQIDTLKINGVTTTITYAVLNSALINNSVSGGGSGGSGSIGGGAATVSTVTNTTSTTTGTVAAGAKIIMVLNNGAANGTFNGSIIKPNESINYSQIANATYPAITYDATGTNFLIVRIN